MKTRILSLLAMATIAVASMTSCSKYEEGGFSLRSKKARLTGEWSLTEYKVNDEVQEFSTGDSWVIEFKKDGTYVENTTFTYFDGIDNVTESDTEKGSWDFTKDKEHLITTEEGSSYGTVYTIIKLTNKEIIFKTEDKDGNETETAIYTFEQK